MRPENLEFPKVFYTFRAKDIDSDEIVEYRVQDLPEEFYEKALELYASDYFPDEIAASSRKLHEKDFETNEFIHFWRETLKDKLSLACFRNNSDELVAVNILKISKKDENLDVSDVQDSDLRDFFEAMIYILGEANTFEEHGVDKYLGACGLVVNRKYRGLGIATEMLKARRPFLETIGLTLTSTIFTGIVSQKAAVSAGYVEEYSISYEDLAKVSSKFIFEKGLTGDTTKYIKVLYLKI